jgi:hypothetical protein
MMLSNLPVVAQIEAAGATQSRPISLHAHNIAGCIHLRPIVTLRLDETEGVLVGCDGPSLACLQSLGLLCFRLVVDRREALQERHRFDAMFR